mgnify:FL=1
MITAPPGFDRQLRDHVARNTPYVGAMTAATRGSTMVAFDLFAAALDETNKWATAVVATGTAAAATVSNRRVLRLNCPAASDTARGRVLGQVTNPQGASATNDVYQQLVLEFVMALGTVANIDNAQFIVGLGAAGTEIRTTADVIGFILVSDALNTLTDSGGTETVTVVSSGPTLTSFNKYKIVVRNGAVDFYVNDVLKNTHTANITAVLVIPFFFCFAEAATGATECDIADLRCYFLDYT